MKNTLIFTANRTTSTSTITKVMCTQLSETSNGQIKILRCLSFAHTHETSFCNPSISQKESKLKATLCSDLIKLANKQRFLK